MTEIATQQETKERVALGAFLAAMSDNGLSGARMREAMIDFLGKADSAAEPTISDNSQKWKGMDGAVAFQLIERHANGWADVGKMMSEWRAAAPRTVKLPPVAFSGAEDMPPVFGRRWNIARDGFGLQRDDVNGNYVHIDDALSTLHQWMAALQAMQLTQDATTLQMAVALAVNNGWLPSAMPHHEYVSACAQMHDFLQQIQLGDLSIGPVDRTDGKVGEEHPAARRMRERFEAKYGAEANVMRAVFAWEAVVADFNRPYNQDMETPVTDTDVATAESEMLAAIRLYGAQKEKSAVTPKVLSAEREPAPPSCAGITREL